MKLEIKVQVPGSSPRDAEFETSCSGARTGRHHGGRPVPERELSAEIEFYPSYAVFKERAGTICGADRVRTDDIQLAKLALSQLSYSPKREKRHPVPAPLQEPERRVGPRWT